MKLFLKWCFVQDNSAENCEVVSESDEPESNVIVYVSQDEGNLENYTVIEEVPEESVKVKIIFF